MSHMNTRDEAINAAHDAGLTVRYSGNQILLVDCDSVADFEFCKAQLRILRDNKLPFFHATYTRSRSGNFHVYVYLTIPMNLGRRLMLQAMLGSDRKHELLNYLQRDQSKPEYLCFLFEQKDAKETIIDLSATETVEEIKPVAQSISDAENQRLAEIKELSDTMQDATKVAE